MPRFLLVVITFCLFLSISVLADGASGATDVYPYQKIQIQLTPEEQQVVTKMQNEVTNVASFSHSKKNKFILNKIAETFGFKFNFIEYNSFAQALHSVIQGQTKLVSNVSYTIERERFLSFSDATDVDAAHLFSADPNILDNMVGARIGAESGTVWFDFAKRYFPHSTVVAFDNIKQALQLYADDKVDALLSSDKFYEELTMDGKYPISLARLEATTTSIAGTKYKTEILLAIISKYVKTETFKAEMEIFNKDYYDHINQATLKKRLADLKFDRNKIYKIAMSDFAPFATYRQGHYRGIFPDLLVQMNHYLGLKYQIVSTGSDTWNELYQRFLRGDIDILLPMSRAFDQHSRIYFSEPFYDIKGVLVRRANYDKTMYQHLMDFVFEKIGVVNGSMYDEYLSHIFPKKHITKYPTKLSLIQALKKGDINYMPMNETSFLQYVNDTKDFSIRIDDDVSVFETGSYHMAFQHNDEGQSLAELFSIAYRLVDMSQIEKANVHIMNYELYYKQQTQIFYLLLCILLVIFLIVCIMAYRLKKVSQLNKYQANYDHLTRLPNRRLFTVLLDQETKRNERNKTKFALLFLDLDGFKKVNDTLGHDMGDLLLRVVAKRLTSCLRGSDIVARLGGDEFVILLIDVKDSAYLTGILTSILEKVKANFDLNGQVAHVSASIGVAVYPEHGLTAESLLSNADNAMYKAKEMGKEQYYFYDESCAD